MSRLSDITYRTAPLGLDVTLSEHATVPVKVKVAHTDDMRDLVERVTARLPQRRIPGCFQMGNRLIVHPAIYGQLKREIARRQETEVMSVLAGVRR